MKINACNALPTTMDKGAKIAVNGVDECLRNLQYQRQARIFDNNYFVFLGHDPVLRITVDGVVHEAPAGVYADSTSQVLGWLNSLGFGTWVLGGISYGANYNILASQHDWGDLEIGGANATIVTPLRSNPSFTTTDALLSVKDVITPNIVHGLFRIKTGASGGSVVKVYDETGISVAFQSKINTGGFSFLLTKDTPLYERLVVSALGGGRASNPTAGTATIEHRKGSDENITNLFVFCRDSSGVLADLDFTFDIVLNFVP